MKITPIQLAKRVEAWQKRLATLGIAHFDIKSVTVTDEMPNSPDALASVRPSQHYDELTIWFSNDFLAKADDRSLDTVIIHELLHVAWRDFDASLDPVEKWMPEAAHDDWHDRMNHEREGITERLAVTLYNFWSQTPPRFHP